MPNSLYLERAVSALKSDSTLHLGNYFGALHGSLNAQELYPRNNFLFVANRHFQADFDANTDAETQLYELVRDFLALGFDPDKTTIYRQSDIRELFSLMWLLSCHTSAMHLWEKCELTVPHDPTVAQVLSPQLMAADIIGLRATQVCAGFDEEAFIQYAVDVAGAANDKAHRTLIPKPQRSKSILSKPVLGLSRDALMSARNRNVLPIFETESTIRRLISNVYVLPVKKKEPINPDTDICFQLFSLMAKAEECDQLRRNYLANEIDAKEARSILADKFFSYFGAIRERRKAQDEIVDTSDIEDILAHGQKVVRREMRQTIGILETHLYRKTRAGNRISNHEGAIS